MIEGTTVEEEKTVQSEKRIRQFAIMAMLMLVWILVWALVLKMGSKIILVRNYQSLKDLTLKERILWDIIPFNYRGDAKWKLMQVMNTILNCFVLAPFGVILCYIFKKPNVWRNAALCLGFSLCIEMLQVPATLGNPATEDLITNTLGCFIGHGLYILIFRRMKVKQTYRFLLVSNVILVLVVIFSVITTAMAADTIFLILTKTL